MTDYEQFFPSTLSLETPRVVLRRMHKDDYATFLPLTQEPSIWKYFTKDLSDPNELEKWMDAAFDDMNMSTRFAFTIIDKDTKAVCGSTSYGNISFYDKRVEIGWTWLGTDFIGAGINQQAKFALLSYAFEVMQMERVEVKTDNLNERAKAALRKIGMQQEGVLRSHMQMHSNRRRDSVYYGVLKNEWEYVKQTFFSELM